MEHLLFLWHILALLSGLVLFSFFSTHSTIKQSMGFSYFSRLYLVISGFLLLATVVLYIQVNITSIENLDRVFISVIPLFIGTLNVLIPMYEASSQNQPLTKFQKLFAGFQLPVAGAIALLPWLSIAYLILPSLLLSVVSLIITLVLCTQLKSNEKRSNKLSAIMASQSIILPVSEGLLWPDLAQITGLTFSLPLIFLLNNYLLWRFSGQLFGESAAELSVVSPADTQEPPTELSQLSRKERDIAAAVSEGLSNKQIAARFNLSPSTVKNHLYAIFKKLGVTNRTALAALWKSSKH